MLCRNSIIALLLVIALTVTACGVDLSDVPPTMNWTIGKGETVDQALVRWHKAHEGCFLLDYEVSISNVATPVHLIIKYRCPQKEATP
jgi:hypothetical protein